MLNTGCVRYVVVLRERGRKARLEALGRLVEGDRLGRRAGREHGQEREDVVLVDRLVERDVDGVVHPVAEVDARVLRGLQDLPDRLHATRHLEARRVEVVIVQLAEADPLQRARQQLRVGVDARGDRLRSPSDRDTRRRGRRCSRAAPARCRCSTSPSRGGCAARASAAPCGTPCCRATSIETPMMRPGACRTCDCERGEERRMRAAIAERHAEALRVAVDDVGAHLTGRRQQREAQQIRADGHEHAGLLRARDERTQIADAARVVRRLDERAEHAIAELGLVEQLVGHQHDLDPERFRARAQHVERLGIARIGHQELRRADRRRRPASPAPAPASSSPRRRRSPRRAATRWPPPSRSGRSPSSGS